MVNRKGFTLAEVMIAMGVLGVLAAILVPAIMTVAPNSEKVRFKKAYYTLEKAISNMINDSDNYPIDQENTTLSITRGFNYTTVTVNATANKFCYLLSQQFNTVGSVSCATTGQTQSFTSHAPAFNTSDGIAWYLFIPVSDTTTTASANAANANTTAVQFPLAQNLFTTKIMADVNGASGPNCTSDTNYATYGLVNCADDPDRFIFAIRYDGKMAIGSRNNPDTVSTDTVAEGYLLNPTDNE